jgi:hypothetical protein
MNCKPGDLALIVGADHPQNLGRIVQVVRAYPYMQNAWWVKHNGRPGVSLNGLVMEGWSFDHELRPIRDPGDDAADESHAWLPPVPTTTKEFV